MPTPAIRAAILIWTMVASACTGEIAALGQAGFGGSQLPPGAVPLAIAQEVAVGEGGTLQLTLTGQAPPGEALTFSLVERPRHGTLEVSSLPRVTYAAERGYVGDDTFRFTVRTASGESTAATVLIHIGQGGAGWWDNAFAYRRRLRFQADDLAETLEEFPVLLRLEAPRFDAAKALAGGADVRFVDDAGNVLKHEIEAWIPGGASTLWVKLPVLPSGGSELWMYYGNPGASPPLPADARQVWSNGFAGVWHLAGSAQDSSPQQFDAESTQGTFPAGVHGPGMRFNRTNGDFFRLKNNLRVVSGASSVTFSAWVKPDGAITEKQANIVGVGKSTAGGHASWVSFYLLADGGFGSEAGPDDAGYHVGSTPAGTVPVGSWTHLAAMIDVAGKSMRLFKNGARVGAPQTFDWERAAIPNLPSYATAFGTEEDECCYFYNGFLDELRLERVGRSDAWLGAQYRNLSDPEFTSLGAEEARP